MLQDEEVVKVAVSKPVIIQKPKRKKREYNKLTRDEMWELIQAKHKILKNFGINQMNFGDVYIKRDEIWNFFVELELHTSNRLTEKQKAKVKTELIDKL